MVMTYQDGDIIMIPPHERDYCGIHCEHWLHDCDCCWCGAVKPWDTNGDPRHDRCLENLRPTVEHEQQVRGGQVVTNWFTDDQPDKKLRWIRQYADQQYRVVDEMPFCIVLRRGEGEPAIETKGVFVTMQAPQGIRITINLSEEGEPTYGIDGEEPTRRFQS